MGCVAGVRWPGDTSLRIGVPEVHMWAWSDPSLPVQLPANHGQLKGRGQMTCSSVDIIDVVRCCILLLPPLFSAQP